MRIGRIIIGIILFVISAICFFFGGWMISAWPGGCPIYEPFCAYYVGMILLVLGAILVLIGIVILYRGKKSSELPIPAQSKPQKQRPPAKISSEKIKMLEQLIKVSSRVKIDDMAGVLEIQRNDLLRKLLELSGKFNFTIEEDVLVFNVGTSRDDFVQKLEQEFDNWGKSAEKN